MLCERVLGVVEWGSLRGEAGFMWVAGGERRALASVEQEAGAVR